MTVQIEIQNVTKIYNFERPDEFKALHGVSCRINEGSVTVLKGPSGSGKTTLLSLIGCMAKPTSGSILLHGRDMVKLTERFLTQVRRNTFGFIFQQFNLIRDVSVMENILLPLYPTAMPLAECRQRGVRLLEKFGIASRAAAKVNKLSGGEQQRVAIVRALVNEPEIIIADEPTAHLDQARAEEFLGMLWELSKEGRTVVIATHDPLVFESNAVTQVVELHDGGLAGGR